MTHEELLDYFGGSPTRVSECFGISKCAPFYWKVRGVPLDRQIVAEWMSGGVLKADVEYLPEVQRKLWECAKAQYELKLLRKKEKEKK